jgi:hypothetical protein
MTVREGERRTVDRRKGDRVDRWLNRFALGVAVILLVLGVRANSVQTDHNEDRIADIATLTAQIQSERVRNTVKACQRRNADHRQLVAYLTGLVPKERFNDPKVRKFIRDTRKAFPAADCRQQAREQVKPSP